MALIPNSTTCCIKFTSTLKPITQSHNAISSMWTMLRKIILLVIFFPMRHCFVYICLYFLLHCYILS